MISLANQMWELGKEARRAKAATIAAANQQDFDSLIKEIEKAAVAGNTGIQTTDPVFSGVEGMLVEAGFKVEWHHKYNYVTISWESK